MTAANDSEVQIPREPPLDMARRPTAFEILAEALHLVRRYAATFAGIVSLWFIPRFLLGLAGAILGPADRFLSGLLAVAGAAIFPVELLALAAISVAMRQTFEGDAPRALDAIREAVGVLGRLLWTYILLMFCLLPAYVVVGSLVGVIGALPVGVLSAPVGLYLMISLAVVNQVVVFERRRGVDALSRSWLLMSGQRSKALLVMLGAGVGMLLAVASSAGAVALGLSAAVAGPAALFFFVLTVSYFEVLRVLIYVDIRTSVEGMTLADLRRDRGREAGMFVPTE